MKITIAIKFPPMAEAAAAEQVQALMQAMGVVAADAEISFSVDEVSPDLAAAIQAGHAIAVAQSKAGRGDRDRK